MLRSLNAKLRAVLKNPYKLFVWLTHRGCFRHMPDERYLKLLYRGILGRTLHLDSPVSYCEKVQWLKLNDRNPMYPQLCDKLAVRDYVRDIAGEECLIPLLGVWDDPNAIDFGALPDRFVLKCTHDSGGVIVCAEKEALDMTNTPRKLHKWLKRDYSYFGREWPYHFVPHRVIAEAFIGSDDGILPDDYKFYCWQGKVFLICVCTNRRKNDADYILCDAAYHPIWTNDGVLSNPEAYSLVRPPHLEEMFALAEQLSAELVNTRIDLYDTPQGVRFGEITLYDESGFIVEYDEEFDRYIGTFLRLEELSV